MVHLDASLAKEKDLGDKGLKSGALGLFSSVVVGVASTEAWRMNDGCG